jgi:hypothetical protein
MILAQLRSELADVVRDVMRSRDEDDDENDEAALKDVMNDAKVLLADYCNAVRDFDFMAERMAKARDEEEDDPFQLATVNLLDLCSMRDAGLVPTNDGPSLEVLYGRAEDRDNYEQRINILPGASRHSRQDIVTKRQYLERLGMGLAGGTALIIPMLIMVLRNDLITTLVTTAVATMLFAGALALLGTRLKGETVLASVAAYAAVLVVFVGTSG